MRGNTIYLLIVYFLQPWMQELYIYNCKSIFDSWRMSLFIICQVISEFCVLHDLIFW